MTETRITDQRIESPAPAGRVTPGKRRIQRSPWLIVLLVVPLATAACGSVSPSANVANLGSTTSTTTANATSGTPLERYAACMRSHGVPQFPDPTNNGMTLHLQVGPGQALDPESPRYQSAQTACSGLVPSGVDVGAHTITPAEHLDYLKAAACMRARGVADFPDPTITDGQVKFVIPSGLSTNSPHVQSAITVCRKLIPAGLPYSS